MPKIKIATKAESEKSNNICLKLPLAKSGICLIGMTHPQSSLSIILLFNLKSKI